MLKLIYHALYNFSINFASVIFIHIMDHRNACIPLEKNEGANMTMIELHKFAAIQGVFTIAEEYLPPSGIYSLNQVDLLSNVPL